MKIAVTGEGPTDYGKEEYGTGKWLWGPIEVYLRRVAEQEGVSIELVPISRKDVENYRVQSRTLRGISGKGVPSRKLDKRYADQNLTMEDFREIAESQDIETVQEHCKLSFGKFCADYRMLLENSKNIGNGEACSQS